ncbi:MAG: bifunctional folylpolyglutamate synthase/dihydrofolate synthase [Firmicutes bacterium]|nr:bifunctional folylpolyglutamate synthase/dihydrofolate synthase [Bacillota bacterium]
MTHRAKAIEKIHEFERFGSVLGLERMTILLENLGHPHEDLKVIHVAGTNGKGSTCRYMYSILQEAGYKTGLYTSPFLEKFNERIEFNGDMISDEDLSVYTDRVLAEVKNITDKGLDSPTEFEVVTAIAFLYFKEKGCDYVVLEVGLGGSGDSTNVCKKPVVTAITSVSFDHMDRLGNTIEEIAKEKAGIIKEGCPVVTSCKDEAALAVIKAVAEERGCKYIETKDVEISISKEGLSGYQFEARLLEEDYGKLEISMTGRHQIDNAVGALTVLKVLEQQENIKISDEALYAGLKKARQYGRFEVMTELDESPVVIIDGAHNIDGATALRKSMESLCKDKKVLMAIGMLADKDVNGIIGEFTKITKDFVITEPENPRKLTADKLAELLEAEGCTCYLAPMPEDACAQVEKIKDQYDVVLFAGSLYLIGKIRSILKNA